MINRCGCPLWEKHSNFKTCKTYFLFYSPTDWSSGEHGPVHRQLSVSSDSKLLDDDIREETRVIMRPKKPPRPKSEVFLNKHDPHPRRKRFSAFGVSCQLLIVFYALYELVRSTNFTHKFKSCETVNVEIFIIPGIFIIPRTENSCRWKTFVQFIKVFYQKAQAVLYLAVDICFDCFCVCN